jgi:hypothetical protein
MDSAVVDAGIGWSANAAHRECGGLYVGNHRRLTGALRGDEAVGALRSMAGGVRVIMLRRIEAMGSHGTADLELGLPERRGGRHAEPDDCNQGLKREQTGYPGRQKAA